MLVILVDFDDAAGGFNQSVFQQGFFGSLPTGSMADYFREVSYNQLTLTGDVVGLSSGSIYKNQNFVAYVRLPNPKSWYTDGRSGGNVNNFPQNMAGVFRDAVVELTLSGFDFTPYADPLTGEVTHAVVIYAGKSSRVTNSVNDFVATAYKLQYYYSGGFSIGDFKFNNFIFCPEKDPDGAVASIGVCAHEFGHALGLPDLYDISAQTSGAGFFDLMAYGVYADYTARRPAHMGAYSKVQLGWIVPETVNPSDVAEKALAVVETTPSAVKVPVASGEYYLFENRQFTGFDDHMRDRSLCSGTYIWHIDEGIIDQHLFSNTVNTNPGSGGGAHTGVQVVEADGANELTSSPIRYGECEDAWQGGREFSSNSVPAARSWAGADVPMRVLIGAGPDSSMTLKFNAVTPVPTQVSVTRNISVTVRKRTVTGRFTLSSGSVVRKQVKLYLVKGKRLLLVSYTLTKAGGKFDFKIKKAGTYVLKVGITKSKKLQDKIGFLAKYTCCLDRT